MIEFEKPNIKCLEMDNETNYAKFTCEPLERGYGITIGNSLRRILLSSLPGAAITSVKIDGVAHEFATVPNVVEDVPEIIINLKSVRVKITDDEIKTLRINFEGEGEVKAGDIITKIDGVSMNDASQISNTIKNGEKESYEITYIRDGKENTLTLTRKKVFINSVSSKEYDNVGYIQIETFSATTVNQVLEMLDDFDDNITSLVIDLRNNTGGYLDTAYNLSDLFLEKGKVVYQLKGRDGKTTKYRAENGVYKKFDKIVVLINENSASASEILTLALKESADAIVVGNRSFGKGTVQETGTLNSGSMIKYTTSYWLSPKGNSINVIGIKPDLSAPIMQLRSLVGKSASMVGAYFSSSNTWFHWMPSLEGSTLLMELQSGKYIIQEMNSSDVDAFIAVSDDSANTLLHAFCFEVK